jgi:Flp pilus assembly pilin Flp
MWPIALNCVSELHSLIKREDGQDLAEYALVAAVISAGIVAAIGPVAAALVVKFAYIASRLNSAP